MTPRQNRGPGKHRAPAVPLDYYQSLAESRILAVFVFYNGRVTEGSYFEGVSRTLIGNENIRSQFLRLEFVEGTPGQVVDHALSEIKSRKTADREEYDDLAWVVFDKDDFGDNYSEAVKLAQAKGLKVAFSNVCFELWLLLYFREQSESINRKALTESLRTIWEEAAKSTVDSNKDIKHFPYGILHRHGNLENAVKRAESLHANAEKSVPEAPWNHAPVTAVYKLIENLKEYFKEVQAEPNR